METLEDLRKEATELGIEFASNIGAAKLRAKIDEFYESQESPIVIEESETAEIEEIAPVVTGKSMREVALDMRNRASKVKVVVVIDNDQRVNNQTTVATVNCGNSYFDLGTMHIPLNVPVEIKQGFIDVLMEIKIPQHVKDTRSGLSSVVMRPRYSVTPQ